MTTPSVATDEQLWRTPLLSLELKRYAQAIEGLAIELKEASDYPTQTPRHLCDLIAASALERNGDEMKCEKCWKEAGRDLSRYMELLLIRACTPEQEAGPDATECKRCERKTVHQHAKICTVCHQSQEPRK